MRNSVEKLLQKLEDNYGILSVKSYLQYKKNGVVTGLERVNTGFTFDKILILPDGTKVMAWMLP